MPRPLVIIESPFPGLVDRNLRYLRAAMHDSLVSHGEAPFASHALYTQPGVLDDRSPEERLLGIEAGLAWGERADYVVVYMDLGITPGMQIGINTAVKNGKRLIYRSVPNWKDE